MISTFAFDNQIQLSNEVIWSETCACKTIMKVPADTTSTNSEELYTYSFFFLFFLGGGGGGGGRIQSIMQTACFTLCVSTGDNNWVKVCK